MTDVWWNCYNEGWGDELVPEAFSHPAKGAPGLSKRIYDHAFDEGWLAPGALVLDPFGGVAGFGLQAMAHGCEWVGVELEQKFVDLGAQNIALWNRRYSRFPRWCSRAVLLQGDSRNLLAVVGAGRAEACVSSPPYRGQRDDGGMRSDDDGGFRSGANYGATDGQLGIMPQGDFDAAVSSPPYANSMDSEKNGIDLTKAYRQPGIHGQHVDAQNYGHSAGQLGSMRPGDFDAAVSSPPFTGIVATQDPNFLTPGEQGKINPSKSNQADYGNSCGQLGSMRPGDFAGAVGADGVVSSPPYEGDVVRERGKDGGTGAHAEAWRRDKATSTSAYSNTDGNIGNNSGDTFWTAARAIVQQTYAALKPGGVAIWIVKSFVRAKAIVDFPGQWRVLCESCGFVTLHEHHAMLVAEHGQTAFDGTHKRRERKSFFRRLAESKGSPRIDYECVLCQAKPDLTLDTE